MSRRTSTCSVLALLLVATALDAASAQVLQVTPPELEGVGVDEKLDAQIPLDLQFRDSSGRVVALREIYSGQRPVLLSLNYSNCPRLCRVQLNGLVEAMQKLTWAPGEEFDVVSVSIDPTETTEQAQKSQVKYFKMYGRPVSGDGWRFLTGDEATIARLAEVVGFRFKYVPDRKEYSHAATLIVCTPEGHVSRYLHGVAYEPQTLKLALVEAGEGRIGSTLDQAILFCFHFDADSGRYGPAARRIMQAGGGLTLIALLCTLLPAWLHRRHKPETPK